jgi:hypothetical protein
MREERGKGEKREIRDSERRHKRQERGRERDTSDKRDRERS